MVETIKQGDGASNVFSGNTKSEATRKIYRESAEFFVDIMKVGIKFKNLSNITLADLGCYGGELLEDILKNLDRDDIYSIGIDREENLIGNTSSNGLIAADLENTPLKDKSIQIIMARYVLVWNSLEKQKKFLKEVVRVLSEDGFAIIQTASACKEKPDLWRERINQLFSDDKLPELKRTGHYFSSEEEVMKLMDQLGIIYEVVQSRKVNKFSEIFIEKYSQIDEDIKKRIADTLCDTDYAIQTTFLVTGFKGK